MKKYLIKNIYADGYERVVELSYGENTVWAHFIEYDEDVNGSLNVKKEKWVIV